jgi:hypothetical protein
LSCVKKKKEERARRQLPRFLLSFFGLARGNSARFFFLFSQKLVLSFFLQKKRTGTIAGSFFLVRASQHQLREASEEGEWWKTPLSTFLLATECDKKLPGST